MITPGAGLPIEAQWRSDRALSLGDGYVLHEKCSIPSFEPTRKRREGLLARRRNVWTEASGGGYILQLRRDQVDAERFEQAILQHSDTLHAGGPIQVVRRDAGRGLPVPFSTFVGRVRERDEVATLVKTHRLVTLTGAGGSGKTRLALEVVRKQATGDSAQVWLVDLAALTTPALVGEAVAETLGVRAEPGRTVTETLVAALSGRDATIVLDNCEHLLLLRDHERLSGRAGARPEAAAS